MQWCFYKELSVCLLALEAEGKAYLTPWDAKLVRGISWEGGEKYSLMLMLTPTAPNGSVFAIMQTQRNPVPWTRSSSKTFPLQEFKDAWWLCNAKSFIVHGMQSNRRLLAGSLLHREWGFSGWVLSKLQGLEFSHLLCFKAKFFIGQCWRLKVCPLNV